MDSSSDFEFFDFKNVKDEEIKEILHILKGPGSNGCVELPWDVPIRENSEDIQENETDSCEEVICTPAVDVPLYPACEAALLAAPVTDAPTYVSLPTSVSPYPGAAPYLVSRTLPYLRAYPPMGVPFFACPITSEAGTAAYAATPFMPVMAPSDGAAPIDKANRQFSKQQPRPGRKKSESAIEPPQVSSASVPIVPLPVPMPGYPPLPYGQSMYYVPVFNHHPYGGYHLAAPSGMLPVSVLPDSLDNKCPDAEVPTMYSPVDFPPSSLDVGCPDKCPAPSLIDGPSAECPASPVTFGPENCSSPTQIDMQEQCHSETQRVIVSEKCPSPTQLSHSPTHQMGVSEESPTSNQLTGRQEQCHSSTPQLVGVPEKGPVPIPINIQEQCHSPTPQRVGVAEKRPAPTRQTRRLDKRPVSSQICEEPPDPPKEVTSRSQQTIQRRGGGAANYGSSSSPWTDLFKGPPQVNGVSGRDMSNGTACSDRIVKQ